MHEIDPFNIFRTTLFIGVAVYTVLSMAGTAWRAVVLLRGNHPRQRFLRVYVSYQIVTVRLRPLASELAGVGFWIAALLGIWWLHGLVE
ncbi:MAG: hypothetical protein ABIG44_17025 [Planctomycetota bacterium]